MSTFDERRAARAGWPVRRFALGEEPLTDERDTSTPSERVGLVWTLTQQQWALAGLPMPSYSRSELPIRIVRPPKRDEPRDP